MQSPMTATEAWLQLVQLLIFSGQSVSPRPGKVGAGGTYELINYTSVIDMNYPVFMCTARKLDYRFMCAEAAWILSGDNRVSTIAPWAPSIAKFSDDGERFFGAYGPQVVRQLGYVVDKLKEDNFSRQAVMTIWRQNPPETKDVPCTVSVQWFIRNGRLHCVDTMRSSDVWLGWPYDVFNFTILSLLILHALKEIPDLQLGNLYLNAGSQHLYSRNFDSAVECLRLGSRFELNSLSNFDIPDLREFLHSFSCGQSTKVQWLDELKNG